MINNYEAVIFDMDGTLIDSMWMWQQIDIDFLEERGLEFPSDLSKGIEGMSYTETAEYFIERFDLKYTVDELKKIWHEMAVDYLEHKVKLKDGIIELLELIKSKAIPMGIGTSASRDFANIVLKANGIAEYFDVIRTSCEVEKGKPFPYIFLKVAEDLGVEPKKCLVFEDTEAGVDAALNAGMDVVAVHDEASAEYKEILTDKATEYVYTVREIIAMEK